MRRLKTGVALLAFALVAPGIRAQMGAGSTADQPRVFQIRARNHSFSPNVIIVNKGDRVRLVVAAVDHDYGFELKAFHINQDLKQGTPATINFTADKAGKFTFRGSGIFSKVVYAKMKGTLEVKEPSDDASGRATR
jgi:heme/copper-type cytochrome/quinol oxidase subunit 2